jgi:hypothetical protein
VAKPSSSDQPEIPLTGGRSTAAVVRVGDTVRRPTEPWTPAVHALLGHLRESGFTGAPLPLGFDEHGRQVLEFIEGEVLAIPQDPIGDLVLGRWPAPWRSDEALAAAGDLLRRLHEAARGFRTEHADWRLYDHAMRAGEIICHGDAAPWNAVYRDGAPVAFIDFDSARPDTPLLDLATSAWHFVPLTDAETAGVLGFGEVAYGPRLAVFLDAYGLGDRSGFLRALQAVKVREAGYPRFWRLGPAATASYLDHVASQLRWLAAEGPGLERALR